MGRKELNLPAHFTLTFPKLWLLQFIISFSPHCTPTENPTRGERVRVRGIFTSPDCCMLYEPMRFSFAVVICDLKKVWFPAKEHVRVQVPATAPISFTGCASARGRVSKTQLTPGGTEAACQFHLGPWQTSNAPALQAGGCGSITRWLHQPSLER